MLQGALTLLRDLRLGTNRPLFPCIVAGAFGFLAPAIARATVSQDSPQTLTLDGQLYQAGTTTPLLDSNAQLVLQILDVSRTCVLYEEKQNVNTSTTNGSFNILFGSSTGSAKRTANDPGHAMALVYQNKTAITATNAAGQTCAGGAYTPSAAATRFLRVIVTPSSSGTADTLSPDLVLNSAPNALIAQSVQGLEKDDFLQVNGTTASLTQANLAAAFTGSAYANLQSILAGHFLTESNGGGASLPSYSTGSPPASPAAGSMWYDSTANTVKYYNGTTTQTIGTAGIGSLTVTSELTAGGTAGGTLSSSGTIGLATTGVAAGTYPKVTVDTKGRVSAGASLVESDIPNLTTAGKIDGGAINAGTIGGSAAVNTSGNLTTTGTVTGATVSATNLTARNLQLFDGGTHKATLQTPATLSANYSLTLPTGAGTSGQVLSTDGTGVLSWVSAGGTGTVSSVTAGTGLNVGAGPGGSITAAGTLNVNVGTGASQIVQLDASSKLPAVDGSALTNLNASNLASGTVPAARMPAHTGDVTSSAGSVTLTLATVTPAKGGTGLTSLGTANQILGVNAGATALEYKTITAGSGVTITPSAGALTISSTSSGGSVTNVTATAPISVATGTTTPAISIAKATASVDGYLAAADFTTFSGKLDGTSAFAGDVTGTSSTTSVDKIKGKAVTYTSIAANQYLKYDGTGWVNSNIAAGDITSGTLAAARMPAFTGDVTSTVGTTALTLGTVPVAKGGTALTTVPTNGQLLIGNGTGYALGTLTAGTGISVTNAAGGITIAATGGGGSVTQVTSANTDIGVATGTSTPLLTLNSGTSANQIVKLDASAKLPAVDGSALTNVNAAKLQGTAVTITTLTSGNYLKYNGTAWVNVTPSSADLSDAGSLIKSSQMPANCSASQTLTFSSPTGTWNCSTITMTPASFGSQTANTILAAPDGTAGNPSFRALAAGDLPKGGAGTIVQGNGLSTAPSYTSTPTFGVNGSLAGSLILANGSASGASTTIKPSSSTTTAWNFTLPANAGTSGYFLKTDGSGNTSWAASSGAGTVNSGTANQLAYYNATGTAVSGLTSVNSAVLTTNSSGVPTWATSSSDSFSQYALLAGRSGGQSLTGGTAASNNLTLDSTSNGTKGSIILASSGGNVGIGTSSPASLLTVAAGGQTSFSVDGAGTAFIGDASGSVTISPTDPTNTYNITGTGNLSVNANNGGALQLQTGATTRLYVAGGGNVGIGTSTPGATLDLAGTFLMRGPMSSYTNAAGTLPAYNPNPTSYVITDNYQNGTAEVDFFNTTSLNGGFQFYQMTSATAATNLMTVTGTGTVGIGTNTPRGSLDVRGAIVSAPAASGAAGPFDFKSGNLQYTTNSCGSFSLYSLKDGGSYSFAVKGTSSTTCSFTLYSDSGTTQIAAGNVHMPPDHGPTITGKLTLYTFQVFGGDVFVSWTAGY